MLLNTPEAALEGLTPALREKLINMLGIETATQLTTEVLKELQIERLRSPDECFRFGEVVGERGGMFSVLGRTIQTHAILRGAKRGATSPRTS